MRQSDEEEQGEDRGRQFIAVADSLSGKLTDNHRHLIARAAFMHAFRSHPRVIEVFNLWGRNAGIIDAALTEAKALDELAEAIGLPDRGALFLDGGSTAVEALASIIESDGLASRRLQRRLDACEHTARRFARHLEECVPGLDPTPETLVIELVKPGWPWVAIELLDEFFRQTNGYVLGVSLQRNWWIEMRDGAPRVSIPAFTTMRGESRKQARLRLTRWYVAALIELERERTKDGKGRLPRTKGKVVIERNVLWFYQHRVEEVTKDQLAREFCSTEHARYSSRHDWRNDRKTIRDGIAEAERLLALVQYEWK